MAAHQAPLSTGFSRQEYWSGLPFTYPNLRLDTAKAEIVVFPSSSVSKETTCNAGDLGLIPGLGRYPGEGKEYPLWPGEFHGLYSPWGCKELDMTEQLSLHFTL